MRTAVPFPAGGRRQRPRISDGVRIYAIGDVHGRLDLLQNCLSQIDDDISAKAAEKTIHVFLGDYIDRGPASRQTLDCLIERAATHESVFLRGNHEWIAIRSMSHLSALEEWLQLGGQQTLMSYGIGPIVGGDRRNLLQVQRAFQDACPRSHFKFFSGLRNTFECGDYFFTHAGVRPAVPLSEQVEKDLLFIRYEFLQSERDFGKVVVHGHTPVKEVDARSNRINIDTGAYATGRLTTLIIEGDELFRLDTLKGV